LYWPSHAIYPLHKDVDSSALRMSVVKKRIIYKNPSTSWTEKNSTMLALYVAIIVPESTVGVISAGSRPPLYASLNVNEPLAGTSSFDTYPAFESIVCQIELLAE
jgi:hypothetical protein